MLKILSIAALMLTSQLALAHEGHGVAASSLFHYLSAPHLLVAGTAALVVCAVAYLALRRRHR